MIFLIHYERSARRLVSMTIFADRDQASKAKLEKELELLSATDGHEVVLLEAQNESVLRETHRRYFESLTDFKSGETDAFDVSKSRFVKIWDVREDASGWLVRAEGMPEFRYPNKELAYAAAVKDAKAWSRSTGNPTDVRVMGSQRSPGKPA